MYMLISKIKSKKGLSVIEIICITVIVIILALALIVGLRQLSHYISNGNDSLMADTAESIARVNVLSEGCVVDDCKSSNCSHKDENGFTIGYYEPVTRKIVDKKPEGYNEFFIMKTEEGYYRGSRGTRVIQVKEKDEKIEITWVKGEEN